MEKAETVQIFKICLMMIILLTLFSFLSPYVNAEVFGECSYHECILDEMPGVENDFAAGQIARLCYSKCKDRSKKIKTKYSFSGKMTAVKCTAKYSKNTKSERGSRMINHACYSLYPSD
jgi:hypothetical protein